MTLVEICVDDLDGLLTAQAAGADRVELCAGLLEGGTTPSLGLVRRVLDEATTIGVQIMIRPRGGDFVYSASELSVMTADLRAIASLAGTARVPVGFVLGALTPDARVDVQSMTSLLDAAGDSPVTMHKAFDETADLLEAFDTLTAVGVERILTSGRATTATEGIPVLRELVARSATTGGPRILAGGSVRPGNVAALVAATGVSEVHLRAQLPSSRGDGTLATEFAIVQAMIHALAEPDEGRR
jgi:copper homeostasis protein CutC